MKPSEALNHYRQEIRHIVLQHHACNVRVFGSVVHGNDRDESDLDLLIDPTSEMTLMDIGAIRYELHQLLGIGVDVLTPNSLPDHFKKHVLSEAILI